MLSRKTLLFDRDAFDFTQASFHVGDMRFKLFPCLLARDRGWDYVIQSLLLVQDFVAQLWPAVLDILQFLFDVRGKVGLLLYLLNNMFENWLVVDYVVVQWLKKCNLKHYESQHLLYSFILYLYCSCYRVNMFTRTLHIRYSAHFLRGFSVDDYIRGRCTKPR